MVQNPKVFLLEDDPSLGATLYERLQKEGYNVQWCESLKQANTYLDAHFDLFILDVTLKDGSGFDFATDVRKKTNSPFLFMTALNTAESRLRGYELGAEEYIPKPFHLKELLIRIQHVIENHAPKRMYELKELTIDFQQMSLIFKNGEKKQLSLKDFKVLQLLIDKSPEVLSRDEILNRVWGEDQFPTSRTVDNCILRLRQALAGDYIKSIRAVGYQWQEESE